MIDFKKFSSYSKAGPRYTSYPTAPEFKESFNDDSYINELKNLDKSRDLSLYFHLPFCRSACYFCGCNVVYTSKEDKKDRYIKYLKKELDLISKYLDCSKNVTQLHFGGGTPTFFSPAQIDEISIMIKSYFKNFDKNAEISCEIDPRFFEKSHMEVLAKNGFNRISFGVQDFDLKVQEAIHRVQSFEETKHAIELARSFNIESINIDLIYGLPYQSFESFCKTLDLTLSLDADRLALFNYAHVPWMKKSMRKIDETTLPSAETKLQILKYSIDFFTTHGYKMIGMDHFAKPNDELFLAIEKGELHRNFQGYTTKGGCDLIGIGLTSISQGENFYAQNFKEMSEYEHSLDNNKLPIHRGIKLNSDDLIRHAVIMELMANFKLNIPHIEEKFNIKFSEYFKSELAELKVFEDDNLLKISQNSIEVNETGSMLIRNIAMPFDSYLKKIPEDKRKFSKTV
ncbi:MAG: oxygen-independent coproporphyrinogen III oxidase [Campylobacterales bacterium]|nr:oxygen-independent coproporphyrinogen III oxidase [Campylobacterales bacterium]